MKKIFLILFALMLTICDDAVAQTSRTISGTVEDARKEPIIGATIRIDGIPSGTMTITTANSSSSCRQIKTVL